MPSEMPGEYLNTKMPQNVCLYGSILEVLVTAITLKVLTSVDWYSVGLVLNGLVFRG